MKIRIDKEGHLFVDSKIKACPYATSEIYNGFDYVQEQRPCGDWCALFSDGRLPRRGKILASVYVDLCHKTHGCSPEDFTDERPKP